MSCVRRSRACADAGEVLHSLREGDAHKSMIGDTIAGSHSVQDFFLAHAHFAIEATDRTAAFRTIDLPRSCARWWNCSIAAAEEKAGNSIRLGISACCHRR